MDYSSQANYLLIVAYSEGFSANEVLLEAVAEGIRHTSLRLFGGIYWEHCGLKAALHSCYSL